MIFVILLTFEVLGRNYLFYVLDNMGWVVVHTMNKCSVLIGNSMNKNDNSRRDEISLIDWQFV